MNGVESPSHAVRAALDGAQVSLTSQPLPNTARKWSKSATFTSMFGIIRPCRHRLGGELADAWAAQLCGLCLALRDDHGQTARVATNYDGLVIGVLVEAQTAAQPGRRTAGRCLLRGMRKADVAIGDPVRLAAAVSLVLAAARTRDHVDDRDGVIGAAGVRSTARRIAERWVLQGADTGRSLGFDTAVLVDAMDRQGELEAAARVGSPLLAVTEPTETAVAAAFGHTAVLADRPENVEPLNEIGRLFGRVAHTLDAVEDYADDVARSKWNPLAATGTSMAQARTICDDAVLGIELALAEVHFADDRLVNQLLVGEVRRAVHRAFGSSGRSGCSTGVVARDGWHVSFGAGDNARGSGLPIPGFGPPHGQSRRQPPCLGRCRDSCKECCCNCGCEGCCECCTCDC